MAEAVAELNPCDDLRQAVLAVEFAPFLLRRYHQLERHGQAGRSAQAPLGPFRSVSHGGEGALDRVGRADVFPVFGRKIIEGQKRVPVLD